MTIFPTKILLATDGSGEAELAASTAADLAAGSGSELHVVHVGHLPALYLAPTEVDPTHLEREARELLEEQVRRIEAGGGKVAEAHLRMGRADREVIELAEAIGAGLIVLGSRGLGGIRRALMGSVSDATVRHAHCPVLVVRDHHDPA